MKKQKTWVWSVCSKVSYINYSFVTTSISARYIYLSHHKCPTLLRLQKMIGILPLWTSASTYRTFWFCRVKKYGPMDLDLSIFLYFYQADWCQTSPISSIKGASGSSLLYLKLRSKTWLAFIWSFFETQKLVKYFELS